MYRSIVVSVLGISCFVASCQSVPHEPGSAVRASDGKRISDVAPIEVAVAPIVDKSGGDVPRAELRGAFHKALADRRYSPLALAYVDRRIVDASFTPGAADEQAALTITIERWDTSLWESHGAITAKMSVKLIDARGGGEVLWSATADQRFEFPAVRDHMSNEADRVRFACSQIATELLARLPLRTARPGRAAS